MNYLRMAAVCCVCMFNSHGATINAEEAAFEARLLREALSLSPKKNVCVSPYVASLNIAMLKHGARGETLNELEPIAGDIKMLCDKSKKFSFPGKVYNKIFINESIKVKDSYLKALPENTVLCVDFVKNPKQAIDIINKYIEKCTNREISRVVSEDMLTGQDACVYLSILKMNCPWLYEFDPKDTRNRKFLTANNKSIDVPTMAVRIEQKGYNDIQAEWLDFGISMPISSPNKNVALKFVCLMPPENVSIHEWLSSLSKERLDDIRKQSFQSEEKQSPYDERIIILPKFNYSCSVDMKRVLMKLGIKKLFDTSADFSGFSSTPTWINLSFQNLGISVNERGARLSALMSSFAPFGGALQPTKMFYRFNRPFIFMICDDRESSPIYCIGVVCDPSKK